MNQVQMNIIIAELNEISQKLYDEAADRVEMSYEIDKIIDQLQKEIPYLKSGL